MARVAETQGTVEMDSALWTAAIKQATDLAHARFQDEVVRGHISRGSALVRDGLVRVDQEGSFFVQSSSNPEHEWYVNGQCNCDSAQHKAPEGRCKHIWAKDIYRKAFILMSKRLTLDLDADVGEHAEPTEEDPAPGEPLRQDFPPHFIVRMQGKRYIRFVGLLHLAHERGLVELRAKWTHNDEELSLAHAVAIFENGNRFEESGDSTPSNAKKVGEHWRRMSLTRAKARALRDALNCDLVAYEEMEG